MSVEGHTGYFGSQHGTLCDVADFRGVQYNGSMAVIEHYHITGELTLRASLQGVASARGESDVTPGQLKALQRSLSLMPHYCQRPPWLRQESMMSSPRHLVLEKQS
ncbi:Hypothetical predicted protein [Scomber scombrus]|uniref:Uncharacterized protein n=1 Tax=Scomber scombrus TaxID=13677 RepID=A0AAV1NEW2_SCOSC